MKAQVKKLWERLEEAGAHLQRFAVEEEILTAAGVGDWDRVFGQIDAMKRPVDRRAAGQCLEWALQHAPVPIFHQLLNRMPKGEYVGRTVIQKRSQDLQEKVDFIEVQGTLTLLAAACGKVEHLTCLLDHGWDVNSASPDAAKSLMQDQVTGLPMMQWMRQEPAAPFCPRPESMLCVKHARECRPIRFDPGTIRGVTPLAAALICGQTECVRVLMDHGAWREEAPSVTRGLMLPSREHDAQYQACRRLVLAYGESARPMALWSIIHDCEPEQLEEELRRCAYPEREIVKAVETLLMEDGPTFLRRDLRQRAEEQGQEVERLRILERYMPQVLRQERQVSLLLRWSMAWGQNQERQAFLISMCPERLDLSMVRERWMNQPVRRTNAFLRQLCEGRTCVIARDSVPPGLSPLILQTLMSRVTLLPSPHTRGVSGVSRALLNSENLRLIQRALETGIIPPAESTEDLLRCQMESGGNTAVRTLLLTTVRPTESGARPAPGGHSGLWFRWMPEEIWEQEEFALVEQRGLEIQEQKAMGLGHFDRGEELTWEMEEGVWKVNSLLAKLCLAGCERGVEHWAQWRPQETLREVHVLEPEGAGYELAGTGLCIAAFAGQRRTVEILLELGAEAEEQHMGMPGFLRVHNGEERLPVTALMAALVRGHWEIARLLLDNGAFCDLRQGAVKALWAFFRQDDMLETVHSRLEDYLPPWGEQGVLMAGPGRKIE